MTKYYRANIKIAEPHPTPSAILMLAHIIHQVATSYT